MKLHTVYRPNWHRFIAVLLAISLVLIPVHFPKRVSAEGTDQKIPANYFTDDFSDNRYSNGVTYKWNQNIGSGNTAIVENGVYKIAKGAGSTYSAISRLTVRDSEADHSYEWKDHTVELKYMREPESSTVTQANALQIFAKIQEDAKCYYRLQLTGNLTVGGTGTFSLFKFYYDEESQTYTSKELGRSGPTTTPGVWYTIRMEFSGNRIKVYYDDKLQINVEDENAYEKGAIELRTQGNSGSGITYIDDFSVTPSGGATVFSDSFVDDRYFNGTTYQWNHGAEIAYQWEKHHTNGTSSSIGLSDQQYADTYGNSLNVDRATSSAADYILLTVKSPDGTDITASWEDYTVEADIRRNTSTSAGVYLMGKVHRDSNGKLYYYALKIHSNHVYLNKYFISSTDNKAYNTASIILASSAAGEGNWAHARMTFEGNRITASLTYIKNGAETTVTNTITDNGTWTSGAAEAGPYFEAGGVGIRVDRAGDTASWVANIDNFKVTSADGTVLFYDDFSDETYFNGKTTRFDPDAIEPWDINWTLNESKLSGTVQSVITEAGTYKIAPTSHTTLKILGTAVDPKNPQNTVDATSTMTHYTLEMDYVRHNMKTATTQGGGAPWLFFNMRSTEDTTWPYAGAVVKLHSNGPYAGNFRLKNNYGSEFTNHSSQSGGSAAGNWRHVKVEVAGAQQTVSLYDMEGNLLSTKTYYISTNETGFFGLHFECNSSDTYVDEELGYERSYEIDNLKVTLPSGKVAFEETFTLPEGMTKTEYMSAVRTVEGGYELMPTDPDWNVEDGEFVAQTNDGETYTSINVLNVVSGGQSISNGWNDYAVEADFMLAADDSKAGLIARYNGPGKYYQMVVTAEGVKLNKVDGITVTPLDAVNMTIAKDVWQYAKLTVNGTKIEGNINGEVVVSADISSNVTAYTAGGAGLMAVGTVAYDNVACFAPEMAESRVFNTFDFNVESVENLVNWNLNAATSGRWDVADKQLTYIDDTNARGTAMLKAKTMVSAASIVTEAMTKANGSIAVIGRYSATGYYKLEVDTTKGLTLYKCVNGAETAMASLSLVEAYAKGIRVEPDSVYTLKLQMVDNTIAGFINDYCVFPLTDADPLPAGVGGVEATGGSVFDYLEIATLSDVVKTLEIVKSIDHGVKKANATYTAWNEVVEVPVGGTPDIKNLYLKVTYFDDSVGYVALDTVELSDFDVTTPGEKQLTVTFGQGRTTLAYNVIDRTTAINNLNAYLNGVNASALTLANKAEIESNIQLYNDLSPVEKALVSETNRQKLAAVRTALEDLIAPEVAGSEVVFADEYDTVMSEELYENHNSKTGTRNSGYWYVDDGKFVQYSSSDEFRSSSYYPSTIVDGGYWNVKSVSADMRIIDQSAWVGMHANFTDSGSYRYTVMITDKVMNHKELNYTANGTEQSSQTYNGTRVDLYKNTTLVYRLVLTGEDAIQTGQWYNLKMTMVDGKVRVYLDNEKVIEWNEISDVTVGGVNTEGTVGLLNSEGWGEFDNFIVRGTEADSGEEDTTVTLEPGEFQDNFDDEIANVGKDPSHWIEATTEDKWTVVQSGNGLAYGTNGATVGTTKTWLHVFETDVDYTVDLKITDYGYYPVFGLVARDNATDSYIRAGYDATFQKWFIKVRLGGDFEEAVVYSDATTELSEGDTVKLRLLAEGRVISLLVNDAEEPVVVGDAGRKVMPGRVGVYTERCDVTFDNVDLQLLSGQGRVNEGVWEYYAAETGITTSLHQVLELPDGKILVYSEGNHFVSDDGGKTFNRTSEFSKLYASSLVMLPKGLTFEVPGLGTVNTDEGVYVGVSSYKPEDGWTSYRAYLYTNNLQTKTTLGYMPTTKGVTYAQPGDHMNLVKLDDGTYRLFHTAGRQSGLEAGRAVISETYYSDDFGQTWKASANSPQDFTNLKNWCETKVIKIKDGPLIQYCSYNTSEYMRYSLSYDGGVTWEGDYAMPTIPTCLGSFSVTEDPYEPGTYYMATIYNYPYTIGNGRPRHRIALLRSYDGINWDYMADVDRWGDVSDGGRAEIMQNVNMYIDVTEDYVFPGFSRSDTYDNNSSGHNKQIGRIYRFEKDKLEAYDEWPAEYYISPKAILYIEGAEEQVQINSTYPAADTTFTVHYYDGTSEEVALSEAYYSSVDTSTLGEKEITLDFGLYRDVYTIQVIAGEIPVISGIEDGKVYCGAQEVTITDADNNLASVTLDGEAVALVDGKFTVSAKEGQQTIAATDELGNVTTVKITVNAAHSYTNYESVGDDLETAECDNGCGNTDFRVVEP